MNDNVSGGLTLGANLFLACVLVSLGVLLMQGGKALASTINNKISTANMNIAEDNLTRFDGATVKGADVINCIKQNSGTIEIEIEKLCGRDAASAVATVWSTNSLGAKKFNNLPSYATDDMQGNPLADGQIYINPNADFTGEIQRNANGMINKIVFKQTKYRQDAYEVPDTGNTTIVINNTNEDTSSALATAIAGLTAASNSLDAAVSNLQNSNSGANTVQAETLAILQTLSTEVLPGMSQKLDELDGSSGSDSTLDGDEAAKSLKDLQGKVSELYEIVKGANFHATEYDLDDVQQNVDGLNSTMSTLNSSVSEITARMKTLETSMQTVDTKLNTLTTMLDAHAKETEKSLASITSLINNVMTKQETQDATLDAIAAAVTGSGSGSIAEKDREIASLKKQIEELKKQLNAAGVAATVSDLQEYSEAETAKADSVLEFQSQYRQVLNTVRSVSDTYETFDAWLAAQPEGHYE